MTSEVQGLVSPSDIAHMAGVSRAAVSNWRRRLEDFPEAVAGTDAKPLFSKNSVEEWLRANGRVVIRDNGESAVWAAMNVLRPELSAEIAAEFILTLCCARKLSDEDRSKRELWEQIRFGSFDTTVDWMLRELDPTETPIDSRTSRIHNLSKIEVANVAHIIDQVDVDQLGPIADFVLERLAKSQGKTAGEWGFPGSRTSTLLANLAAPMSDGVLFDPACGIAVALVAAAEAGAEPSRIVGAEINVSALRIAQQRAYLHDLAAQFYPGDIFRHDIPDITADVIVLEPPFGQRLQDDMRMIDPRFAFGTPPRSSAETAWLQIAIAHLTASGCGYVLTPNGPLFRGGAERAIRNEMLRRGCIEAIVSLPSKMLPQTSIPLALWVLRAPDSRHAPGKVRLIDAATTETPELSVPKWIHSGTVPSTVPHVDVPIHDLLGDEATLLPSRWLVSPTPDVAGVAGAFERSQQEISTTIDLLFDSRSMWESVGRLTEPRIVRLGELLDAGLIELNLGRYSKPTESDLSDLDGRIVTQRHITKGFLDPAAEGSRLPNDDAVTQPGDILFSTINKVRGVVDESGGHIAGGAVGRLRIMNQDIFSPCYVALMLNGRWNDRHMSGSTIQRAQIRDLELPLVPIAEQEQVCQAAAAFRLARTAAERLNAASLEGLDALADAVRYNISLQATS